MDKICTLISVLLWLIQGTNCQLKMEPSNIFAVPGENVSVLCHAVHPIMYCRIKLPGFKNALNLSPRSLVNREYAYYGSGLDKGDCGVTLLKVGDKVNGEIECTTAVEEIIEEYSARTTITVLRGPKKPRLWVAHSSTTLSPNVYRDGDALQATCEVKDGRPVANITWYLGEDVLKTGIRSEVTNDPKTDFYTIRQTLTTKLTWKDNSKELRCVGGHALMGEDNHASKTFNIAFAPKSMETPIERYGLTADQSQNVTVEIFANPRPLFTWMIGKTKLQEGETHSEGNIKAAFTELMGQDKWKLVLSFKRLTKKDVQREYNLYAKNSVGERSFKVVISTDNGPPLKLGTGLIILITIVVVCLIALVIIFYVLITQRRKRKLVIEPCSTEKMTTENAI